MHNRATNETTHPIALDLHLPSSPQVRYSVVVAAWLCEEPRRVHRRLHALLIALDAVYRKFLVRFANLPGLNTDDPRKIARIHTMASRCAVARQSDSVDMVDRNLIVCFAKKNIKHWTIGNLLQQTARMSPGTART
jgi:hypothetical protein